MYKYFIYYFINKKKEKNMRKISIFLMFSIMMLWGMQVSAANVITLFSEPNLETNPPAQYGWSVNAKKVAAAKYFVIETEGVGGSEDGFGGLQFAFQGGVDGVNLDWSQTNLWGDWITFPRAEEKIVSIVIDLKAVMNNSSKGEKYDDFIQCTDWAEIHLGHWSPNFAGLAIQKVFLTEDFDKPEGAVDYDYGFIFEGSAYEPQTQIVINFEEDALGIEYPIWQFAGGGARGTALMEVPGKVVESPLEDGNCLYSKITGYDQAFFIGTVTLPEGVSLFDCEELSYDLYTTNDQYKEIIARLGEPVEELKVEAGDPDSDQFLAWASNSYKKLSPADGWGTIRVLVWDGLAYYSAADPTGPYPEEKDQTGKALNPVIADGELTTFDIFVGVNDNAIEYYLNNVVLTFNTDIAGYKFTSAGTAPTNSMKQVKLAAAQAFGIAGGIQVNADAASVFSFDGRLVKQVAGGFTPMAAGLYIIKVGGQAVKVAVR